MLVLEISMSKPLGKANREDGGNEKEKRNMEIREWEGGKEHVGKENRKKFKVGNENRDWMEFF